MSDTKNSKKCLLRFTPTNDWRSEDQCLYDEHAKVSLYSGEVKCFVGCNGAGKSTLLEQIESQFKQRKFIEVKQLKNPFYGILSNEAEKHNGFIVHFNSDFEIIEDFGNYAMQHYMTTAGSTGEQLFNRFGEAAKCLGECVAKAKETNSKVVVLWDDCDVGTSIDVQDEIVDFIKYIKEELTKQGIDFTIVLTANSFELCRTFNCYDCNTLKQVKFGSYDKYKEFVLKTRKRKDERNDIHS